MPRVPVFSAHQVHAAFDPATRSTSSARPSCTTPAASGRCRPRSTSTRRRTATSAPCRRAEAASPSWKWVNSYPNNPAQALPTVSGVVLLSEAETGQLLAVMDAGAVTGLRTGAAAVLAAEVLAGPRLRPRRSSVPGERPRRRGDLPRTRPGCSSGTRGRTRRSSPPASSARARRSPPTSRTRLASDIVVTVTPGREVLFHDGTLHAGQHVSLMGADGPGKAEIAVEELLRARVVCDEWEQASHNGDIAHALETGACRRERVAELGRILLGEDAGGATSTRSPSSTRPVSPCGSRRRTRGVRAVPGPGETESGCRGRGRALRKVNGRVHASHARPGGRATTSRSRARYSLRPAGPPRQREQLTLAVIPSRSRRRSRALEHLVGQRLALRTGRSPRLRCAPATGSDRLDLASVALRRPRVDDDEALVAEGDSSSAASIVSPPARAGRTRRGRPPPSPPRSGPSQAPIRLQHGDVLMAKWRVATRGARRPRSRPGRTRPEDARADPGAPAGPCKSLPKERVPPAVVRRRPPAARTLALDVEERRARDVPLE